ncbi:glycosyltransferase [Gammaproteobacteria bacterium]|nr:glycosyltransferase [Gammaproteobacteria bacterium]
MKPKVVHVIVGLMDGGAEGVLARLCIHSQRFEHIVISLTGMGKYGPQLEKYGISVYCLNLNKGLFGWCRILYLAYILRVNNPTVVQTWMYHSDLIGGVIAWMVGIRHIYWGIRHSDLNKKTTKSATILVARVCAYLSKKVPKKILCCANKSLQSHARLGYDESKMITIPNGYDLTKFFPDASKRKSLRDDLNIDESIFLIGNVGRFHLDKGHDVLLESLCILKASDLNWHCLLVGRDLDENNEWLSKSLVANGLEGLVSPMGSRVDIPNIMNALDLHVLASRSEGFPNVLAEAMACGTACASTDVGDAAEIILSADSLCRPNAPDELANIILNLARENKLLPDKWDKRRRTGSVKVQEKFALERMVQAYEKVWLN